MDYVDYDYMCSQEANFPEVEEVINEATDKFEKIMHDMFQEEYNKLGRDRRTVYEREKEVAQSVKLLKTKEEELNKRLETLSKDEKELEAKLKQKWFKELGLAFDVGETVYYCEEVTDRITCPLCHGERKVTAKVYAFNPEEAGGVEVEIACPKCNSYGYIRDKKKFKVVEAVVRSVDVHLKKKRSGDISVMWVNWGGDSITHIWVENKEGDNVSHYFTAADLFKTKEDAMAYIKSQEAEEAND